MTDHHPVLQNGREDVVCSCGQHYRSTISLNGLFGESAIEQWARHYQDTLVHG